MHGRPAVSDVPEDAGHKVQQHKEVQSHNDRSQPDFAESARVSDLEHASNNRIVNSRFGLCAAGR